MREFDKQMEMVLYHSDEGELAKEATISKIEIVQREGTRDVKRTPVFYNLDAIISVGYRVNSIKV